MKHRKNKAVNGFVIYCPRMDMERAVDTEPVGFCPICKNRIQWTPVW